MRGTTQPMPTTPKPSPNSSLAAKQPSYYSTPWAPLNNLLAIVDERSNGRAGLIQRFATFLMVGGFAAVVNLAVFELGLQVLARTTANAFVQNLLAYLVAMEISILANFFLNDPITFSRLPGHHDRPWLVRCLRFHMTCIVGVVVTYTIESVLHFSLGVPALLGEAVGIIVALFFNFTVHHLFTYRHAAH